jgi:RHS repeat-associated protein
VDFIYSGRVPVHEVTSQNRDWTGWIFKPEEFVPIARVQGDRIQAVIADHLGTPHEMIDRGKVSWMHRTTAFGAPAVRNSDGGESCPFRFQGQYEDAESGLHYNMFRYYDPECGRFISPDPLGVFTDLNLYLYAPNPIGWIDPLGLCRRGNAATQKHMDDIRDKFLADNPGFVLQSGGRDAAGNQIPERLVQAPGVSGVSGGNFPDMTFVNPSTGAVVHVNTVDPRASGPAGMTPREYNNAQNMSTNANSSAAATPSPTPASGTGSTVVPSAPTVVTVNKGATPAPGSLNTSTMTPGTVNYK